MFFTHNDQPAQQVGTCNCTGNGGNSNSTGPNPPCPPDWDAGGRDKNKTLRTYMSYSRLPFTVWSKPVLVPLLGFDAYSDTAFSGAILRNGSLIAMTRTQGE
jgi:hypothetical protein